MNTPIHRLLSRHVTMLPMLMLLLAFTACTSVPVDPAQRLLDAGEAVALRMPAQLMHDHDMQEQPYDTPEGYRPISTYQGELLLTDRRLLFIETTTDAASSWLSIPYAAVARARPSRTALLNYLVVWDADGHADSFVVDARQVKALHREVGQRLLKTAPVHRPPTRHAFPNGD